MFNLFKMKEEDFKRFTYVDSFKKYHIKIDDDTISLFPDSVWKYIYKGFYKWKNRFGASYNLIKRISYIKNSEYKMATRYVWNRITIKLRIISKF